MAAGKYVKSLQTTRKCVSEMIVMISTGGHRVTLRWPRVSVRRGFRTRRYAGDALISATECATNGGERSRSDENRQVNEGANVTGTAIAASRL